MRTRQAQEIGPPNPLFVFSNAAVSYNLWAKILLNDQTQPEFYWSTASLLP